MQLLRSIALVVIATIIAGGDGTDAGRAVSQRCVNRLESIKFNGATIGLSRKTSTLDECYAACLKVNGCKGVSHNRVSGACWTYGIVLGTIGRQIDVYSCYVQ